MTSYLLAFLIGIVAGLRSMTAPALVSWAAHLGRLDLDGTWLAFLGYRFTPWIFTVLALAELFTDQLPATPSRTAGPGFIARIASGALCGAAVGTSAGGVAGGIVAGIAGAVVGTYGGHAVRARLATTFHRDRPAAFLEDAVALGGAVLIGTAL